MIIINEKNALPLVLALQVVNCFGKRLPLKMRMYKISSFLMYNSSYLIVRKDFTEEISKKQHTRRAHSD